MGSQKPLDPTHERRWYEDEVKRLYSCNLFLREEEIKALQESARALDAQAACAFLLDSAEQAEGGRIVSQASLRRLILALRQRQSERQPASDYLSQVRENALAVRKAELHRGILRKLFRAMAESRMRTDTEQLKQESLQIDLSSAEERHKASFRLLTLAVADAWSNGVNPESDENLKKIVFLLKSLQLLRQKRALFKKLLVQMQRDPRISAEGNGRVT